MKLFLSLALIPALLFAQTNWIDDADSTWYTSNKSATTYTITTAKQLAGLAAVVNRGTNFEGKTITLGANIVLNDTNASGGWRKWDSTTIGLKEWTRIGNLGMLVVDNKPFRGNFDGKGKVISGLYINTTADNQGLFGGSSGNTSISNLGLVGFYVKGGIRVSGIIGGINTCIITNSYAIGNVNSTKYGASGIMSSHGTVVNSYFIGTATATCGGTVGNVCYVGGIMSTGLSNPDTSKVRNSYFAGTVTGSSDTSSNVGGIIGMYGTAISSFYDATLAGNLPNGKGTPKTTAEMKQKASYQGWDWGIWGIGYPKNNPLNGGMPYLQWQTPVGQAQVGKISDTSYTGSQIKPTPTVGTGFKVGVDFDYEYGANINAGTGSVSIVGKTAAFWGEREFFFNIKKAPSTDCKVTMTDFTASGTPSDPVLSSPKGTYVPSQASVSYKSLNNNSYSGTSRPANAGVYSVTATFPANANYEQCTATANFTITEGDCTPKKIPVSWTSETVFTYNKMVQAPVPSVNEPGVELLRSNAHSAAGIYKGQDAAYAIIKDDAQRCNYALTNNTKDYEIKKKDLKPYFKVPATLPDLASNTDTLWVPREIFADSASLRQTLSSLLSYDGFAQDTVTKEKDDASVLKNTPAISLSYTATQALQKMLAKRVETTQTAVAVINTEGVSADNYSLAKRSIVIMETEEDNGIGNVFCLRDTYCSELSEDVCEFFGGVPIESCGIKVSCLVVAEGKCATSLSLEQCRGIGGTVVSSCESATPTSHSLLATSHFRVWQTASGVVNVDLGYIPTEPITVQIYNLQGKLIATGEASTRFASIRLNAGGGVYLFKAGNRSMVKVLR
jgi:hypothetical protein